MGEPSRARAIGTFLGLFALYYVVGHFALESAWGERFVLEPWTRSNVRLALASVAPLGLEANAEGRTIITDRPLLNVNRGCDGTGAALIVIAAIAAFPARWSARWPGILVGLAGVYAINAVRIATLLWAAVHRPTWLDTLHVDVWQPAMMVFSFGLFLLWSLTLPSSRIAGPQTGRA
jgi:exosortase/archaeosortase family protein